MKDLIERQAAIDAVCKSECEDGFCGIPCPEVNALKALPPAQPERKKGKWIDYVNSHCECSVCHTEWSYFSNETECFEFCPNCGADMREADDERPD